MAKGKFTTNPFRRMSLNSADMNELQVVAKAIANANMERYQKFLDLDNSIIDRNKWKLVKSKDEVRVYLERAQRRRYSPLSPYPDSEESSDLQSLLCVGRIPGTLEDVMYGIVSPTLEGTRTKASYTNDISSAAVLSTVKEPTDSEPFKSVVVKWMELDVRLKSMGFVKNRDYVYVESTGIEELPDGQRVGYHVMHSIDIPQAHVLPGRVRAKLSVCSFFRQVDENYVSVYVMGVMDPMSDRVRRLIVPSFVKTLLSTLKYAHCGEMKKLTQALGERYAELKHCGPPNPDHSCITCTRSLRVLRFGRILNRRSICKLCFGFVCSSCKIDKKLSFPTPDLQMTQRKVTFCPTCVKDAMMASSAALTRAEVRGGVHSFSRTRKQSTWSSDWGTVIDSDEAQSSSGYNFASTR